MNNGKDVQVTRDQAEDEIRHLSNVFPVVRLLDAQSVEEEESCLLHGQDCPCMRKVASSVLHNGGEETRMLRVGDNRHRATVRYLEVDGEPNVLLYALPVESETEPAADPALLYIDALTGVYNRRFYEDKVRRQRMFAGVAVIDLDDFKLVNDALGHHAGDLAISAAARAMKSRVRESDILLRYGGDEFVLVLPNISEDDFVRKLESISKQVAQTTVPGYDQMSLSVSIGGVLSNGSTVEEAVKRADSLMYRAKQRRNSVITEADVAGTPEFRKPLLLIVDDSEMNREILKEMLHDEYDIIEAANGKQGISYLEQYGAEISLVLLDIIMPVVNGFEVLSRMVRSGWIEDIPVIMISSEESDEAVLRAYELGASDYIGRPFDMRVVRQRVSNIMRLYARQRRLSNLLAQQYYEREKDSNMLVNIMGGAMELRNGESGPHVLHVRNLTDILLERLVQKTDRYALSSADRNTIAMASTLHDIGKLAITDSVLNKPGRLTPEEYDVMKTHTTLGAQMLEKLNMYSSSPILLKVAHEICRWHHERWDGSGYPDGLKGDEIPISAQVVSLADVYDALTSARVYKEAVGHDEAMRMILDGECGTFNPILIECLVDVQERIRLEIEEPMLTPPLFNADRCE